MIDIEDFYAKGMKQLAGNKLYEINKEKLLTSFHDYAVVLSSPIYNETNKINTYNVACILPFNGRHNILEQNIICLNKQTIKPAIILTCSNTIDYNFAKSCEDKYDNVFTHVSLNYPLGKKFYDSTKFVQSLGNVEYLMILGSDDLLSLNYIENSINQLGNNYDLIGSKRWLLYTTDKSLFDMGYKKERDNLLGGGRIYSKRFLDSVDWEIFNPYMYKHLDDHGENLLNASKFKKTILTGDNIILSIKGYWDCINSTEHLLSNKFNTLTIKNISDKSNDLLKQFELDNDEIFYDKPKICILTTMFGRGKMCEFVFDYYKNLKYCLRDICHIELIACGSEGSISENIAINNGFNYIEFNNLPLSQKHNQLFIESKKYNPDFTILIGSDDLICENTIYNYIHLHKEGIDYSGILDFKFIDKSGYWYWSGYNGAREGEPVGGGRFFSNRLLTQLHWKPWANVIANSGLDGIANMIISTLRHNRKTISFKDNNVNLITIRSGFNITKMENLVGKIKISNPLNSLLIDKMGPINNLNLSFDIISDLNPKTSIDEYNIQKLVSLIETVPSMNDTKPKINSLKEQKKQQLLEKLERVKEYEKNKLAQQIKNTLKSEAQQVKNKKLYR